MVFIFLPENEAGVVINCVLIKKKCVLSLFNGKREWLLRDALLFHVKRALFQCGVWSRCLLPKQDLPSPGDYGWSRNEDPVVKWVPLWLTTKEASRECREFVKCTCSQTCTRCKCALASFKCTLLCTCKCTDKVSYNWSLAYLVLSVKIDKLYQ